MDGKASTVIKVPTIPVVVKKGSTLSLLKNNCNLANNDLLMRCIKLTAATKDQVIYKSSPGDFLRGEFPELTLVSRLNIFNQTCSTVAKFINNDGTGTFIEKNSNAVVKVIGQNNYDTVFSALCSVISQELRIRALLALLTVEGTAKKKEEAVQTEKTYADSACQTDETSKYILDTFKQRKRIRRQQFRPYIVKEDNKKLKRVVIDPKSVPPTLFRPPQSNKPSSKGKDVSNLTDEANEIKKVRKDEDVNESFPELSGIVNEDSNFSDCSIGNISMTSQHSVNIPQLLENPTSLLNSVDDHTAPNIVPLTLLDGSVIMVCEKPMDKFHCATPDNLKNLSNEDRIKLLYHQVIIHWKYCLEKDEDGYLPIHHAVMSNDLEFLNRQCSALMKKYGSVDIPAAGNMTALQMSINKDGERCTAALLQHGADPCLQDDEGKSFFHTAAEVSHEHLKVALDHCRVNARTMLKEDEDLWNPVMEDQSDEQLAKILLDHICIMCDNQGYTPLMLASKQGNHASAQLLLQASPETVNRPTPNSGSTALYLAVEAACIEATNSTNHTKISEKFLKTIEILMESGGDPGLENHLGTSVNILLTEFNIVDLSVLIANKLTSVRYFDGNSFAPGNINSLMLVRNSDGKVDLTEIRSRRARGDAVPTTNATADVDKKVCDDKGRAGAKVKRGNVEIMEIKTINPKGSVAELREPAQFALPAAVDVKPSHFIIVPKKPPKAEVPRFVKILPKLDNSSDGKRKRAGGPTKDQTGSKDNPDAATKINNADSQPTPGKKQRNGNSKNLTRIGQR